MDWRHDVMKTLEPFFHWHRPQDKALYRNSLSVNIEITEAELMQQRNIRELIYLIKNKLFILRKVVNAEIVKGIQKLEEVKNGQKRILQ